MTDLTELSSNEKRAAAPFCLVVAVHREVRQLE
jgi:hypothetical protein